MRSCDIQQFYEKIYDKTPFLDTHLELTYRCNLKCLHCYCQGIAQDTQELNTQEIRNILDKLYSAGCFWLILTGGEPLLREDFLDIYSYAKERGFLVTIFTNGSILTDEILSCLSLKPPYSIEITLNAITEKTFDKITGARGFLPRVLDNIRLLDRYSLPVVVKTSLMSLNAKEFPEIKRWVSKYLKNNPSLYPFKYTHRIYPRLDGNLAPLRYRLPFARIQSVLKRDKDVYGECRKEFLGRLPSLPQGQNILYQCNSFLEQIFIDPFGRIKFCPFTDKYSSDLRKTSFSSAHNKMIENVGEEKFKTNAKCRKCDLRPVCHWCPARAKLEMGNEEEAVPYYCDFAKQTAKMSERLRLQK